MKTIHPADGPVNVNRFTLYAMIPGLDTYAVSKIDKKKQAAKITMISVIALLGITGILMFQMINDSELNSQMDKEVRVGLVYEKYIPTTVLVIIGFLAIYLPIITHLVRKWSNEWNKQFES